LIHREAAALAAALRLILDALPRHDGITLFVNARRTP